VCSRGLKYGVCLPRLLAFLERRNPARVGILSVERILPTISALVLKSVARWEGKNSMSGPGPDVVLFALPMVLAALAWIL
jgi:hypothetical protein